MSLTAYYFRVYALLAVVALVVTLICGALAQSLNNVRERAWREAAPQPLMQWLAAHPDSARFMTQKGPPSRLRVRSVADAPLSDLALERLSYGQVVADRRSDATYVYYLINDDYTLELRLQDFYRSLSELSAELLIYEIDRLGHDADVQEHLQLVGVSLGVEVTSLTSADQLPSTRLLERVTDQGFAYYHPEDHAPATVYARLASGQLVEIRSPKPFTRWAWPVILLAGLAVGGALGLSVYYMLSRLHKRLRSIENAVARIARGELDARVSGGDLSIAGRLGDSFNRMAEHIQRLVMVQREMIHGVSHELRTPVARIRFGVQMIEDCTDPDELQSQLAGIDRDIQELDELIDEILTYARLEQGGPVFAAQRVNMVEIVEQVVQEQQVTKPDLSIVAQFEGASRQHPEAEAEPRYIHRAIQNLVGNATRYAKHEVRVVSQFDGETCRVDVHDDGPGIPEEEWEKVFTAFARLDDSRTRSSGGYGLGLSIVRRILHWHSGQAFVGRSELLGGASFSLVWPRTQPKERRD